MNKFQKTLASAFVAGSLLVSGAMPLFASTTLTITGNGTDSTNTTTVNTTQTTSVSQSNDANVTNNVDANSNSGGNDVKDNTGGNVSIDTGNAKTTVTANNTLNSNTASVNCCHAQDTDVTITGNGSNTTNTVDLTLGPSGNNQATDLIQQSNYANVHNDIDANAKTGDNKAKDNTGGSVYINTGDATTSVTANTVANANSAQIGNGDGESGSLTALITGNGTKSVNDIDLTLGNSVWFVQDNNAHVSNDIYANAKTGNNDAKDNTGGAAAITTGNANVQVAADTATNFNWADADCGCLLTDLMAKIGQNGSDTTNSINATLDNTLGVTQDNCKTELALEWIWFSPSKHCGVNNDVDANAKTGNNNLKDSTGDPGTDPSVDTGDATTKVNLTNSGNANVYGTLPSDLSLPDFGNLNLHFSFDLNDLLSWLMSH